MIKYAAVSTSFLILALGLFSIPLILKYYVYKPQHVYVMHGDSHPVGKRFPSLWCEGLALDADVNFNAYQYDHEPSVQQETTYVLSTGRVKLPNKAQEYWRFHLLKGTNFSVSSCVKLSGASITLVRGNKQLHQCLAENEVSFTPVASLEDVSDEESEGDTSSISSSQGVLSNETDDPFICSKALEYQRLESSYRCNSGNRPSNRKVIFDHHVHKNGFYYLLFTSDTYLDIIPNEFYVQLVFDRTAFDHKSSLTTCSNDSHCEMPLSLGLHETLVIQIPGVNGTLEEEYMKISCQPRKAIFFVFYLFFALLIFVCAFQ